MAFNIEHSREAAGGSARSQIAGLMGCHNHARQSARQVRSPIGFVAPGLNVTLSRAARHRTLRFSPFWQPVTAGRVVAGTLRMRLHKQSPVRLSPTTEIVLSLTDRRSLFGYTSRSEENHADTLQLNRALLRAEWNTDFRFAESRCNWAGGDPTKSCECQMLVFATNNRRNERNLTGRFYERKNRSHEIIHPLARSVESNGASRMHTLVSLSATNFPPRPFIASDSRLKYSHCLWPVGRRYNNITQSS